MPSIKEDAAPQDYTGTMEYGVLCTDNTVMSRSGRLEIGAFDERFETAEDNDLCYRWLKAGRGLRFEPRLAVWHHDWRTPTEMKADPTTRTGAAPGSSTPSTFAPAT